MDVAAFLTGDKQRKTVPLFLSTNSPFFIYTFSLGVQGQF